MRFSALLKDSTLTGIPTPKSKSNITYKNNLVYVGFITFFVSSYYFERANIYKKLYKIKTDWD